LIINTYILEGHLWTTLAEYGNIESCWENWCWIWRSWCNFHHRIGIQNDVWSLRTEEKIFRLC